MKPEKRSPESLDIQPIPTITITEKAQQKLERWGITKQQIESLQHFSSQFRYDLCLEKVRQLSRVNAEFFFKQGEKKINLPHFLSIQDTKGQCWDIARQWVKRINDYKLINNLNYNRNDGSKIVTCIYSGLSRTHFLFEEQTHVWNGLALINKDGSIEDEIYIDASFRSIMTKEDSGYKQKTANFDTKEIYSNQNVELSIGHVKINGHNWKGSCDQSIILGVSNNYEFSFGLGFVRNENTDQIIPVITNIDSRAKAQYFILGDHNEVLLPYQCNLSNDTIMEIRQLLIQAGKINFVDKRPTENMDFWTK